MAFKRYYNSAWVDVGAIKRWNGSAWVDCAGAKRWSGTGWVDVWSSEIRKILGTKTSGTAGQYTFDLDSLTLTQNTAYLGSYDITMYGGVTYVLWSDGYIYTYAATTNTRTLFFSAQKLSAISCAAGKIYGVYSGKLYIVDIATKTVTTASTPPTFAADTAITTELGATNGMVAVEVKYDDDESSSDDKYYFIHYYLVSNTWSATLHSTNVTQYTKLAGNARRIYSTGRGANGSTIYFYERGEDGAVVATYSNPSAITSIYDMFAYCDGYK